MLSLATDQIANLSPLLPFTVPALCKILAGVRAEGGRAFSDTASSDACHDVHATINGHPVHVNQGTSILEAARQLNIHVRIRAELLACYMCHHAAQVPTLCTHPRLVALGSTPPGTCRLCLVDTGGRLQPACATPLSDGVHVQTDTPAVLDNIRSVLSLLRANHPNDCMTCESNGHCEFQDLLLRYKVGDRLPKLCDYSQVGRGTLEVFYVHTRDRHGRKRCKRSMTSAMTRVPQHWSSTLTNASSVAAALQPVSRCRCVLWLREHHHDHIQEVSALGMMQRGRLRHPGWMDVPLNWTTCIECGQCAAVCPTDAIHERSQWREVMDLLESGRKTVVCQTAPAVRVTIGEEFGLAPGSITTGQLVSAQRQLGFSYVFDTVREAD